MNIKPVLPDLVVNAYEAYMDGYVSETPINPPTFFDEETGDGYRLVDQPFTRGLSAMMGSVPDDIKGMDRMAVGMRAMALMEFLRKHATRLPEKFCRPVDEKTSHIHESLMHAAALAPLDDEGDFGYKVLLAEARKAYARIETEVKQ